MNSNTDIYRPSFIGLLTTGLLIFIAFMYFIKTYSNISEFQIISLILMFSIAIGSHSNLHFNEERYHDFNPLQGKYIPKKSI